MASSSSASSALQQSIRSLQQAYESGEIENTGRQLTGVKIQLAKSGLLFPSPTSPKEDLLLARSALEIGAFHSLKVKDVPAFQRYEALLGGYYRDLNSILPPSSSRPPLLGLSLLSLLASSKIAEFHTLLETLDEGIVQDPYVRWPIDLEQWLMEGSYTKVWRARERVPREEYGVLLDGLVGKIRNDIASCHESAYSSLALGEATRLLFFTNDNDTIQFGKTIRKWDFSPSTKMFTFARAGAASNTASMSNNKSSAEGTGLEDVSGAKVLTDRIAKDQLIKTALEYAVELETIV